MRYLLGDLPVEKKFSTITYSFPQVFPQVWTNSPTVCSLLTYLVPMPYVGFVQHPAPWASTLRTVTPTARSIWMNFVRSTVRIWSTPWPVFFLRLRTSTVLWPHWKTQWTVTKLSTGDCGSPWSLLHYICTWKTHEQSSSHHSLQGRYITDSEDVSSFDCSSFCCFPFSLIYLFTTQHHGNSLTHRNRNARPHCG